MSTRGDRIDVKLELDSMVFDDLDFLLFSNLWSDIQCEI